jgi:hypothetical protein
MVHDRFIGSEESLDQRSDLCKYQAVDKVKVHYHYVRCHLHSTGGQDPCSHQQDHDDNNFVAATQNFHAALDGFSVDQAAPLIVCQYAEDPAQRHRDGRHRVFIGFTGRDPTLFKMNSQMFDFLNSAEVRNVHFVAVFVTNPKEFAKNVAWKAMNTKDVWEKKGLMSKQQRQNLDKHLKCAVADFHKGFAPSSTPMKNRVVVAPAVFLQGRSFPNGAAFPGRRAPQSVSWFPS